MQFLLLLLALALPDSARFKPLLQTPTVTISIARGDKEPWITGTHTLPVDAEKVFTLLSGFDDYARIFSEGVKTAKILTREPGMARIHIVWPLPFPMRNRDAIVKYTAKKTTTGYQIDWTNDPVKNDPESGLRIDEVMGQTMISAADQGMTQITYTYYGDLGGSLPDFIKEASYSEEPLVYFNSIRKQFGLQPVSAK